jgi:serine/threonine-protein kinase
MNGVPFGRYMIRRRLGRGGMGEVFLADQLGPLGPVRPVALKRLLPGLADDEDSARLFLEEMGIAAQLNHPNIATTYDFGEVDRTYFLAMEYVEGLPLNRIIAAVGPLPVPVAVAIVLRVAEALEHAHKRPGGPVVHQDVSPHNVMISRDGAVKLLDFGIARAEAAAFGRGRIRGKAGYAAPEQLRGAAPDRRFDLFALGVVFYECLTGLRPFAHEDAMETLRAAEEKRYAPLEDGRPELLPFADVIGRALEPDPDERWLSAEAFRSACLRLGERFGTAPPADLGLMVERAGGVADQAHISEVSGTGVPALDAAGLAALRDAEDTVREAPTVIARGGGSSTVTTPSEPRPSRRLPIIALSLAAVVALVVSLSRRSPEVEALPIDASVAVIEAPILDPPVDEVVVAPTSDPPPPPPEPRRPAKARPHRPVKARPPPPPPPPAPVEPTGFGKLSVRSEPTWARVVLDGKPIGRTILYGRPFDPGRHAIELIPGEGEYAPLEAEVHIRPGMTTNVFANFATRKVRVEER